jgi:uncharacterized protein YdhG (YjbR/CyaY superfamily)
MSVHFKTVEEYISSFPEDVQKILRTLQKTIRAELPEAEEVISYQIPTFKVNGKYVIYYSAWKKHASLYPFSEEMVKEFPESAHYKTSGKGTIQFPYNKPLPLPLIRKITKFMLHKNLAR